MLSDDTCYWPCDVPATKCQADHLKPAARGGPTDQANSRPCCGHHNRVKERGFTVALLDDGTIEIRTPDGELIPR
ncbi:MAG: HNH endonuclease signature motif containing protein [Actinomycetota bacterium]